MKFQWLWIVGVIAVLWMFSTEKSSNAPIETSYNSPSQSYDGPNPEEQRTITSVSSSPTFMGYSCTNDCSGHEAGYEWAEENDVDDPDDCDGNSESFIEGCQAYAEEQKAASEENTDEN